VRALDKRFRTLVRRVVQGLPHGRAH
jgi:hypothetical protein